jgi:serine/threonine-protein kinase RsbT
MSADKIETLPLRSDEDLVRLRQVVRARMVELAFNLVAQTKMVTAASELGRNTLVYGRGGLARLEVLADDAGRGLRVSFEDHGPGIADIGQALINGYSTGGGLGLGLGGAKRLVQEFEIFSAPGQGTRVTIAMRKSS